MDAENAVRKEASVASPGKRRRNEDGASLWAEIVLTCGFEEENAVEVPQQETIMESFMNTVNGELRRQLDRSRCAWEEYASCIVVLTLSRQKSHNWS